MSATQAEIEALLRARDEMLRLMKWEALGEHPPLDPGWGHKDRPEVRVTLTDQEVRLLLQILEMRWQDLDGERREFPQSNIAEITLAHQQAIEPIQTKLRTVL
jgi:hypothetical protein